VAPSSMTVTGDLGIVEMEYDLIFSQPSATAAPSLDLEGTIVMTPAVAPTASFGVFHDALFTSPASVSLPPRSLVISEGVSDHIPMYDGAGVTGSGYAVRPGDYQVEVDLITDTAQTLNSLTSYFGGGAGAVTQGDYVIGLNPSRAAATYEGVANTNFGVKFNTLINVPESVNLSAIEGRQFAGDGNPPFTSPSKNAGTGWGYIDVVVDYAKVAGKILGIAASIQRLHAAATRGTPMLQGKTPFQRIALYHGLIRVPRERFSSSAISRRPSECKSEVYVETDSDLEDRIAAAEEMISQLRAFKDDKGVGFLRHKMPP